MRLFVTSRQLPSLLFRHSPQHRKSGSNRAAEKEVRQSAAGGVGEWRQVWRRTGVSINARALASEVPRRHCGAYMRQAAAREKDEQREAAEGA